MLQLFTGNPSLNCHMRSDSFTSSLSLWHRSVCPTITPVREADSRLTYPIWDERLSWTWCLLYTEMVYLTVKHPRIKHLTATQLQVKPMASWSYDILTITPPHCRLLLHANCNSKSNSHNDVYRAVIRFIW